MQTALKQEPGTINQEPTSVEVHALSHRYGERLALNSVSFSVNQGEIFGLLGPNGSGKTTLFRVLSTLIPPQTGNAKILGCDLFAQAGDIRRRIGVVFQAPSLDKKLTAYENLLHQGHLYGLRGSNLKLRIMAQLERVKLADRAHELVETFSGGMRRRVELAKGLLHGPQLLLLDEPSTGLDPGARIDLWQYLGHLARVEGVTCLLTTHYMDEAAQCSRLGILNRGELVALDTPDKLRESVGGEVVTIKPRRIDDAALLKQEIAAEWKVEPRLVDETLRIEASQARTLIGQLAQTFGDRIESVTLAKPTLEDVFIKRTGHQFWTETAPAEMDLGVKKK